jgi:hypothetical protein
MSQPATDPNPKPKNQPKPQRKNFCEIAKRRWLALPFSAVDFS